MENGSMEKEDSAPPNPPRISLQRRWAHEYALTQPGYDDLPCPTTNNGASLITPPGTPLPPKIYSFPTPSHEQSRRDPYTPASTPRPIMDMDSQIFSLRVLLALSNLVLQAEGRQREQCLSMLYDVLSEDEIHDLIKGLERLGLWEALSSAARGWASQEGEEAFQEDRGIPHEDEEFSDEEWEMSEGDVELSDKDGEVFPRDDGAPAMVDTDIAMTGVPTINHTDFWVPMQIAGQKRKAPSLLEDPLDAEQPDEETSYEDKFEPFTFDGDLRD
ncbi:unnamed protein product [Clonostachys rosea f. rosea IK726]|uniref:Uncharacterized protein n=1 Tax=Clonostachys rosea f. rosea IK726 TaxID=1349383 RepID=A0ACA9U016_BIOOC|nr:unnamed protein product [Clonostachys rosea f. rosea IK726]